MNGSDVARLEQSALALSDEVGAAASDSPCELTVPVSPLDTVPRPSTQNEALVAEVQALRAQAVGHASASAALEARCRAQIVEAQEHLAESVAELDRVEQELQAATARAEGLEAALAAAAVGSAGSEKGSEELRLSVASLEAAVESQLRLLAARDQELEVCLARRAMPPLALSALTSRHTDPPPPLGPGGVFGPPGGAGR